MAPGRILQIFLRVAIQDQIRIAQRVIVRLHFPIVAVLLPSAACNPSCAVLAGLSGHLRRLSYTSAPIGPLVQAVQLHTEPHWAALIHMEVRVVI